jgi:nucleoside-diphosphate-sugar epimerase
MGRYRSWCDGAPEEIMPRVLITGGAGFIGAAVVHRLVSGGHTVRVLDNLSRGASRRLTGVENDIEFVQADIRDRASVLQACAGVDAVLHLAYVNGTRFFYEQPELVLDVALRGMLNILDGCRAHGVGDLVLMSSSEVYQTPPQIPTAEDAPLLVPDPLNPRFSYGGGKIACELMAINYGRTGFRRVVIVRPHNVYGPDMGFEHVIPELSLRIRELPRQAKPMPFQIQGSGQETRSFVHIDDFVDGFMLCAERGEHRGIYHLGNQEEIAIGEVAQRIARILGRVIEIRPGSLALGGTMRRCPDIGRARGLGYEPRVPLASGLPAVVRWYDENAHLAPAFPT